MLKNRLRVNLVKKQAGEEQTQGSAKPEEGVVDAEFEEVKDEDKGDKGDKK